MVVDNDTIDAIHDEDVNVALALIDSAVRNLEAAQEMMPQNPHTMYPDEVGALSWVTKDAETVRRQLALRHRGHSDYDVTELEHLLERGEGELDEE